MPSASHASHMGYQCGCPKSGKFSPEAVLKLCGSELMLMPRRPMFFARSISFTASFTSHQGINAIGKMRWPLSP